MTMMVLFGVAGANDDTVKVTRINWPVSLVTDPNVAFSTFLLRGTRPRETRRLVTPTATLCHKARGPECQGNGFVCTTLWNLTFQGF